MVRALLPSKDVYYYEEKDKEYEVLCLTDSAVRALLLYMAYERVNRRVESMFKLPHGGLRAV